MQLKQLELEGGGTLTVYLRDSCERMPKAIDRPLVLVVPGGGYTHVSAREGDPVALQFAAAGYHTAVLDYAICEQAKNYLPLRQQSYAMPRGQNNHILYYLDEHFTQPISLDMLAERFFVSKSHLNQMFRKMTGTTVMDYVTHKRVNYVQQLLSGGISAAQAAQAAGFGDYTSFYRAYTKIFGHSPSADKRQLAGKAPSSNAEPLDTLRSFVYRATDRQQDTEPTLWSRKAPTLEGFGDPAQLKDDPSR